VISLESLLVIEVHVLLLEQRLIVLSLSRYKYRSEYLLCERQQLYKRSERN